MRITDVKVHLLSLPAQPSFKWRQGLPGSEPAVTGGVVRIITDEGIEGLAYTNRGEIVADLVRRLQ